MDISWLGHSCFRLKGKEVTLITDPYAPSLGYPMGSLQAHIVTVSHAHPGHSYVQAIGQPEEGQGPRVFQGPGEYEIAGVFITGLPSFHDAEEGRKLGKNTIYFIEMEGLALCHLGDLGHPLTPSRAKELGKVDVLFLPVGGGNTLNSAQAVEVARQLAPRLILPMHYSTEFTPKLEPIDRFLKAFGSAEIAPRPRLSITTSSLPESTQVVLLDYPRRKAAS